MPPYLLTTAAVSEKNFKTLGNICSLCVQEGFEVHMFPKRGRICVIVLCANQAAYHQVYMATLTSVKKLEDFLETPKV
jgi:hypothetical protein